MNKWDKGARIDCLLHRCYNFRARFRFPRAAGDPPRPLRFCGVSSIPLSPQECLALYSTVRSTYISITYMKSTFIITRKKIRTIDRSDFPSTKILCFSLFY